MSDMFEAGKFAALTKNLALSRTSELAGAMLAVSYTHLRAHETQ